MAAPVSGSYLPAARLSAFGTSSHCQSRPQRRWDLSRDGVTQRPRVGVGLAQRPSSGACRATGGLRVWRLAPMGASWPPASLDGTARIWNPATGAEIRRMTSTNGAPIYDLAMSPDGQYLATGESEAVGIGAIATGEQVLRVSGGQYRERPRLQSRRASTGPGRPRRLRPRPGGGVRRRGREYGPRLAGQRGDVSPNGKFLATTSDDRTARLWVVATDGLLGQACAAVDRNLTLGEWGQYLRNEPYRNTCLNLP